MNLETIHLETVQPNATKKTSLQTGQTQLKSLDNLQVVLIDNQDSFTYNLVDELRVLGVTLCVYRNTVATQQVLDKLAQYQSIGPTLLLLSPGPGAPAQAGNMPNIIEQVKGL